MKRLWCIMVTLCLLVPRLPLHGEQFGPWDASVAVGDELLDPEPARDPDRLQAVRGIYDSFTGGALLLIRAFQIWISPQDGPSCRFHPTCSAYGKTAVQKYGAFLGSVLAGDRMLRCTVFARPGDDPVPDHLLEDNR